MPASKMQKPRDEAHIRDAQNPGELGDCTVKIR